MRSMLPASVVAATLLLCTAVAAAKSTIHCPDLSQARQLAECPAEADLKRMFKITCGFERDPDAEKPELCDSYTEYKRRKNVALWESADGEFMAYVSCSIPVQQVKQSAVTGITVSQKNGLYKVSCLYQGGTRFTHRTRSVCRIPGVKPQPTVVIRSECGPDAASCKVECE